MKNKSQLLFLLFGRILQVGLSVVTIRLMTELLDPKEVGHQYLINSFILWFSMVLINPVGMFVNRHVHEWSKKSILGPMMRELTMYFILIAGLSVPILFALQYFSLVDFQISTWILVLYFFVYIFLSTWFQTLTSFFNLFQLQKHFVFLNVFSQLMGITLATLAVKYYNPSAFSWLFGLLLGQIISLSVGVFFFQKKFSIFSTAQRQLHESLFRIDTLKFCYPIAITTIFMWFINQGYRIFIERQFGGSILGEVGVGLGLAASLAAVVESLVTQFFYPKYYSSLPESTFESRKSSWLWLWQSSFAVYIPFCFLTIATAPLVVKALVAAKFSHVVRYVQFGALVELFRQMSNMAYIASHAEKRTQNTIAPYALGAIILFALLSVMNFWSEYLSVFSILLSLILVGFLTLLFNLINVHRLLHQGFQVKSLLKTLFKSLPILSLVFLIDIQQSLTSLFVWSAIAGLYCLVLVLGEFTDWKKLIGRSKA